MEPETNKNFEIILKDSEDTISIKSNKDVLTIYEMMELIERGLLALGYSEKTIINGYEFISSKYN